MRFITMPSDGFGRVISGSAAETKKRADEDVFPLIPINVNEALLAAEGSSTWIALGSEDSPLTGVGIAG